ncbi:Uncharacterized protein SCF082_LOCUS44781, partial [Durusdinium trenchii]
VHVLLMSGQDVSCDPQPDRTVRELREEVQKKLQLENTKVLELIASSGEKLRDELTLNEANVDYGGFLSAIVAPGAVMSEDMVEEVEEYAPQSKYDLQDPKQLIQFLLDANIALVRLEYLQELLAAGRRFLRRQEAEGEFTAAGLPALVQASELQKVEIDPIGNMSICVKDPSPHRVTVVIESISHAWESMEHPDPHGFQLDQIIQMCPPVTSTRSVWLFYDFMSLYQYGGRTPPQEGYFRQALEQMHTLYAHEAIKVRILDELTPEMWKHPGTVMAFSDQAGGVIAVSIDQLRANSTPYLLRGWCQAERQWSRLRISLEACVPMPPELFRHRMEEQGLRFTHHDDKETVLKLQAQVFAEKVRTTKQLMAENLDEEALNTLCAALPFYVDLDEIVVNGNLLPRNAAVAVAKANACSFQMESCGLKDEDVEGIVSSLLRCKKVEKLRLAHNDIGHRGLQALRKLKKAKPDLYIDLQLDEEDEGDELPHQEGPGDRPGATTGLGAEAEGLAQDDHRGRLSQQKGLAEFGKVEAKFRSTFGQERLTRQRWVDVLTTAGIGFEDANALLKDCDQHISVASFFDLLRGKTAIPKANSTLRDQVEAPFTSTLGPDGLLTQQRWIGILTAIGCRLEGAQTLLKDWKPAEYISVRSFFDLLWPNSYA